MIQERQTTGPGPAKERQATISPGPFAALRTPQLSRRVQLVEVLVFLFLIGPSLVLSFSAAQGGNVSFALVAVLTILRDLALASLILYFLWRNSERLAWLGWTLKNGWSDVVLGVVLFVPLFFGAGLLEAALQSAGLSVPPGPPPSSLTPEGPAQLGLAVVLVTVVALAEETIFRGYLMLRFQAITGSPVVAAVLSATIFSLGHGYEGSAGVITVGVMGLALAIVYLWRRSLVAPIVMHFLQDFVGIVLMPMMIVAMR